MRQVWGPAQNAVYADTAGNIGYVMAARIPIRKKGHGEVPVPGDTDEYEWTGYIPFDELPQTLNPESGLIITANARVTGPDYKPYLTDRWEEPYRTARIFDLLQDRHDLRPQDMLKVENDTYSYPHVFLAEQLGAADKSGNRSTVLVALELPRDVPDHVFGFDMLWTLNEPRQIPIRIWKPTECRARSGLVSLGSISITACARQPILWGRIGNETVAARLLL